MALDSLLEELKLQCTRDPVDETEALRTLEKILSHLALPENNTDANCKKVDLFVTLDMDRLVDPDFPELDPNFPAQVRDILGGMQILHDTHTAPEIAENFDATPDQLLKRTREALRAID